MADIFVSYAREDRDRIPPLVQVLDSYGFTVWWDRKLLVGKQYQKIITAELEQARCVIVAWSKSALESDWVQDEAVNGKERGVLVPLTLDGVRPPYGFRQYQTADLSGWTGRADDPRVQAVVDGVFEAVRGEPPPPRQRPTWWQWVLSRRRLLLGVGAVGLAGAGGVAWWETERPVRPPAPRPEDVRVVTVDAQGVRQPEQVQRVEVFDLPVGTATMPFAIIPSGGFTIGSPDGELERRPNEGPQQFVQITRFAMGRTTVTQAQWAALLAAAPQDVTGPLPPRPSTFRDDDRPVETVTWTQATEFCARVSRLTGLRVRLPSEAEWEYACRAGTTSPFHVGPTLTAECANYCGTGQAVRGESDGADITSGSYDGVAYTSGAYGQGPTGVFNGKTVPVRTYPANRFGLYEMHGNVWEYCADAGPVDYRRLPTDGSPATGEPGWHVLRGGAWSHNPAICRSAYRDRASPDSSGWQGRIGFRVVCELDATS